MPLTKKYFDTVIKRDGRITKFDREKITNAIFAAAQAVGGKDRWIAEEITDRVIQILKEKFGTKNPTVEEIQDIVERTLIKEGYADTAKAYILYREQRRQLRDLQSFLQKTEGIVDGYLEGSDWRSKENANEAYSMTGLQAHISGAVVAEYTLNKIYPKEVSEAHRSASLHIHDLSHGIFAAYCAGWSLRQLLTVGFAGVPGRIAAKPAGHLHAAVGQLVNFFGTLQNEWAGAQAVSSFDTYLAPFVWKEGLSYEEVKQGLQEFVYSVNQISRWGNQPPFTNITLDWTVPEDLKDEPAIIKGKPIDQTYGEFQDEIDLINNAFLEMMIQGDAEGRTFSFPIPTYNITKDFNWDSENASKLFEMTAKYGTPYFQNFINSSLKPHDVRSMCCRLQLRVDELKKLRQKTGGLFGAGELTGSVGVVTINMPKLAFLTRKQGESEFFTQLDRLMILAKDSLEIKRKEVQKNMDQGLLPYTKRFLGTLDNHFATIGLCGMHEACLNFLGPEFGIQTREGKAFAIKVLDFMRGKLQAFQAETGHMYNLEATPAEGTSYRFAKHDQKNCNGIIQSGKEAPFYTNSSQLPVDYTDDIFEALDHQDELQCKYTGGTVLHGFLGEKISSPEACKKLVRKIASNYHLPYFTITPTFSVCKKHGYITGAHENCPVVVKTSLAKEQREKAMEVI